MTGPRIEAKLCPDGTRSHQALCCTGYYGGVWIDSWRAQDNLAEHLQLEHGIVRGPRTLAVGDVQPFEVR